MNQAHKILNLVKAVIDPESKMATSVNLKMKLGGVIHIRSK